MEAKNVLEARNIFKSFHDPVKLDVLKDISFTVKSGEFVSVIGRSGCGKSTLLYILSTMDTDYQGDLFLDGISMKDKSDEELSHVRNKKVGFVFQFHYLLPEFSVKKNVMLPGLKLGELDEAEVEHNAILRLRDLGIEKLADRKASQLSGGEKQRVAIARALINDPLILMCDEPTGNLDKKNSLNVQEVFRNLVQDRKISILVVTHDPEFVLRTDRVIEMEDGKILKKYYVDSSLNNNK